MMTGKPMMASVTCGITSLEEGRGVFKREEASGMVIPGSRQESRNHSTISGQAGLNTVTDTDVRGQKSEGGMWPYSEPRGCCPSGLTQCGGRGHPEIRKLLPNPGLKGKRETESFLEVRKMPPPPRSLRIC